MTVSDVRAIDLQTTSIFHLAAINRSDAMMLVGIMGRPVRGQLTAGEAFTAEGRGNPLHP